MAEFKLVISDPKSGKSKQVEIKDDAAKGLIGKKIGDTFKGETIDMPGYEFQVTGGSDYAGFPMRGDVQGNSRKKITDVKSLGVKNKRHRPNPKKKGMRTMAGMKLKKTVAGNTIYDRSAQINLKILKIGRESLFEEPKPAEEAKPEGEAAAEAPKEAPKEEKKMEEPKQEEAVENEEEVKEDSEEVSEKTEEVPQKTEEVPISSGEEVSAEGGSDDAPSNPDGEDVGGAADAISAPEEKKEETEETPSNPDGEDVGGAADAMSEPADDKKEETKTEESPEEEDDSASVEKETEEIEREIAKDEEEIKKEDEEIEKIEKELEEAGKEDSSEEETSEEEKKEE